MSEAVGEAVASTEGNAVEGEALQEVPNYSGTKHKVKVDGEEIELSYEDLLAGFQKSQASDKKFRESARMRQEAEEKGKKYEETLEALKKGDHKSLVELVGEDAAFQMSQEYLLSKMEYDNLSEDQKRIRELEKENEDFKSQQEKIREAEEQRQVAELEHKAAEQIDKEISEVLKESGLPMRPEFVARVAEQLLANIQSGRQKTEPLTTKQAWERARSGMQRDAQALIEQMSAEELRDFLPKAQLKALRGLDVEEFKKRDPLYTPRQPKANPDAKPQKKDSRRMSSEDAFEQLAKKFS